MTNLNGTNEPQKWNMSMHRGQKHVPKATENLHLLHEFLDNSVLEFMLKNQFLIKEFFFLDSYPLISATLCTFICPYSVGWSNNSSIYIRRDKKGGAQLFLLLLPTIVHVCVRNS